MPQVFNPRKISSQPNPNRRGSVVLLVLHLLLIIIVLRLFYWQISAGSRLDAAATRQYERSVTVSGHRGRLFTADDSALVTNLQVYRVFAQPPRLSQPAKAVSAQLIDILLSEHQPYLLASESAEKEAVRLEFAQGLSEKLGRTDSQWVNLKNQISEAGKKAIEALEIEGIGFDPYLIRSYPEASMAAHLTGFVGKNDAGEDVGYFGVEGALDKELASHIDQRTILTDARGLLLAQTGQEMSEARDGRDVTLTIRKDVQHLLETQLQKAIERYGAASGEVIVMDPTSGAVLGMAALPKYDQKLFSTFDTALYKNPTLSSLYEPGSTLKVLTVAAGIEEGVITPDTTCDDCDGPREFGKYTIKTWNNEYHPNIYMTDALAKSDNVAMIFISQRLGEQTFASYLKKFGLGQRVGIELQEDRSTPFPEKWGPVELATTSFGQGITANSFQVLKAISAIANQGVLMKPTVIKKVTDRTSGEVIASLPIEEHRVVSETTANQVAQMMVSAAQHGEAQWIASKTHTVAGKTGTSQIAEAGTYSADMTIASFVGFSPAQKPKFAMIVKLTEPKSSIWAAETAAPLWYSIADRLYLLLDVPPDL